MARRRDFLSVVRYLFLDRFLFARRLDALLFGRPLRRLAELLECWARKTGVPADVPQAKDPFRRDTASVPEDDPGTARREPPPYCAKERQRTTGVENPPPQAIPLLPQLPENPPGGCRRCSPTLFG